MDTLIKGDCLLELKKIESNSIDLIYLDPPFYTQKKQTLSKKQKENVKKYEFEDSWNNIDEYLNYIKDRLVECKRVLKKTGNIFLHCDRNACHYLKIIMDEVFGINNFRSEIIWTYKRWSNSKKGLLNSHQNIYFYSKTSDYKFNTLYTNYSLTTNLDQILQNRVKDNDGITIYQTDENGNVINNYDKKGVPLSDVWEIPYLNPKAKERNGYPTQKPILLLEQIIKIASNEGDVILDPFCGSGTTLAAAKLLNRKYIGFDVSDDAINLCKERLSGNIVKTDSKLLEDGIEKYNNKTKEEQYIIDLFDGLPVQRNSGMDAIIPSNDINEVIAIKFQKDGESLEDCISKINKSCKIKGIKNKIIIKNKSQRVTTLFENDMINNNKDIIILSSYKELITNLIKKDGYIPIS